jgi:hypothetical protein
MNDRSSEFDDVARGLRRSAQGVRPSASTCLDDLELTDFISGLAPLPARDRAVAHLAECASCRALYADLLATLAAPEIVKARAATLGNEFEPSTQVSRTRSSLNRGVFAVTALAAAALLFIAVSVPGFRQDSSTTLRDVADPVTVTAPALLSPLGAIDTTPIFRWKSVDGADLYRVTVFSPDGVVVWDEESTDTVIALPSMSPLQSGATYMWRVQARTSYNRWSSSDLAEFRVGNGSGR